MADTVNDEELGRESPDLFVNGQVINITFIPPLPVAPAPPQNNGGYYYYSCIDNIDDECSPVSPPSVNEPFVIFTNNVTTDKNAYITTESAELSVDIRCQGTVCPVDRIRRVQFYRTSAPGTTGSTNANEGTAVGTPRDVTSLTDPTGGDRVTVNAADTSLPITDVSGTYGYFACYENTNVCSDPSDSITVTAPRTQRSGTLSFTGAVNVNETDLNTGDPLQLSAVISCGGGDCSAAIVRFYVTDGFNTIDRTTPVGEEMNVRALTSDESITLSLPATAPTEEGTYRYFVCIVGTNDCNLSLSDPLMVTVTAVLVLPDPAAGTLRPGRGDNNKYQ